MEFDWKNRTVGEWRELMSLAPRMNWLQSLPFAKAVRVRDQKVTKLALISRAGEAVGLMALQEIKLGPIHVLNLYRGPLWFAAEPPSEWLHEFAELFNRTYPRRWLRRRRWLPEWRDSLEAQRILERAGFQPRPETYETVILDLSESLEALRAKLKQKWRNALHKGEKSGLLLKTDWTGATRTLFLAHYHLDKSLKRYRGRNVRFVKEEVMAAVAFRDILILWAFRGPKPIAGILIFQHGQSATYRVGWTTEEGRRCNAHNVLLWEAVEKLKERGVRYFDLGGIMPDSAEGLSRFKQGMGGQTRKLLGLFS